ncbi:MAG: acyl-CoA dehydrogenase family protein [Archangium sp.]|nr:acyl-CoA dehydrogenase family protein [Archangium sp.]MDP3574031.1 acyl-CoA dehydrogenase family protein [Archangium sp.]
MNDAVVEPLLESIRAFARRHVRPLEIDQQHSIPREVLWGLAELGLFGATLPREWGGAGLSALQTIRVVTALAEVDRSVATTVGLHLGLGTRGLVAWGTRAQQERWLPPLASGEAIAAFATTEPNAGSDLSALQCLAQPAPDGTLQLFGTKLYVTNGGFASLLTVTASTPGMGGAERGTSLLLIDPKTPGVARQREERKLGLRGSSTTAFIFDQVAVPNDAVLGEPGQGASYLAHVLSWGRLLLSAGCVGTARAALDAALAHVHHRRQFHRALVQQEVVQRALARAGAIAYGMEALVRTAAAAEHDWDLLSRLTTSAKVFCSEGAFELADLSLQLHGGSGFIEDTGIALLMRDARVTRIFEGANDVLLTHAGVLELTQPAAVPTDASLSGLWSAVALRRNVLQCEAKGVRALNRRAAQHALGRAVIWRDAATAATSLARTPLERAAAALLCDEALNVAMAPDLPAVPTHLIVAALLEGVFP